MPLGADSEDTAVITFEQSSGHKIKFECKFLTRRQVKEHRRLSRTLADTKDEDAWWEVLERMHAIGLVGWDLDKPYSFEALEDVLSEQDIIDLVCGYPSGVQLTEIEMGKSESRRRFHAGDSAATVPAADAPDPLT